MPKSEPMNHNPTSGTETSSSDIAKALTLEQIRELGHRVQEAQVQKINEHILDLKTAYAAAVRDLRRAFEGIGLSFEDGMSMKQPQFMAHLHDYVSHQHEHTGRIVNGIVPKKYQHPTNPTLAWAGRGLKPRWLVEYLEENPEASIDDLRIRDTDPH